MAAWAPGTSQSSDERPALALLSRKLDYTTADPPKLRPGLVSARLREQGRNGPAASQWPFVHAHPQSLRSFDLLFLTRPHVFRRTHSFLAVSLQTSRSLQPSHSLRCVVFVAESCLSNQKSQRKPIKQHLKRSSSPCRSSAKSPPSPASPLSPWLVLLPSSVGRTPTHPLLTDSPCPTASTLRSLLAPALPPALRLLPAPPPTTSSLPALLPLARLPPRPFSPAALPSTSP